MVQRASGYNEDPYGQYALFRVPFGDSVDFDTDYIRPIKKLGEKVTSLKYEGATAIVVFESEQAGKVGVYTKGTFNVYEDKTSNLLDSHDCSVMASGNVISIGSIVKDTFTYSIIPKRETHSGIVPFKV